MKLLDLFCGAGGAALGYHRAGFTDITGVDIRPQKHYPFKFIQADALDYLICFGKYFDAIHASPPCQRYSVTAKWTGKYESYPDLLQPVIRLLEAGRVHWIVENVPGAPFGRHVELCGLMFGLKVFRHRKFESSIQLLTPSHPSHKGHRIGEDGFTCVAGHGDSGRGRIPKDHRTLSAWRSSMGISWMGKKEITQAIPPAYTEYLGKQLLNAIGRCNVAVS